MAGHSVQVTLGVRGAAAGAVAAVAVLAWVLRRLSPEASVRRRILRRLDRVAPRVPLARADGLLNADCPVCLCELGAPPNRNVRALECRHAMCAPCLERWVVHCVRAHLNPSRFGITAAGIVYAWAPGPSCPLCKAPVPCVPDEDLRTALVAAMLARGSAISPYVEPGP